MSTRRKRLWVIVGLGSAMLVGIIFYKQYFLSRPIGDGPAGPQVSRHAFVNPWTDRVVRFVGIGDSITAGLGARTRDHTSFNRLIKNPEDEYAEMKGICLSTVLPHLEYENLAISGSTSREHLYKTFMGHGAHCRQFWQSTYVRADPHYWFYDNIEDPNDRGYDAIRRVFLNTIVKYSSLVPEPQFSAGNGAEH